MLVVDTNVLVYAANSTSQLHQPCRDWLDRQRRRPDAWYITWAIVYEFLRVSTHPRILPQPWTAPAAWEFVAALLASPGLGILVPTQYLIYFICTSQNSSRTASRDFALRNSGRGWLTE